MRRGHLPLFVYGSLKRGFKHHGLMQRGLWVGRASTPGYRLVLLAEYPALVRGGAGAVLGELYYVDRPLLAELDAFEECPTLYQRQWVGLDDGRQAFAYLIGRAEASGCQLLGVSSFSE
jgi:gamma-glutamylcyclotransferase (GGCT)/AIG2-like uncharacterized protein YtfP